MKDKAIEEYHLNFEKKISNIEMDVFTSKLWIETEENNSIISIDLNNNFELKKHEFDLDRETYPCLKAVGNDLMIFSNLVNPSLANELKLLVLDATKGMVLEEFQGYKFDGFNDNGTISISKLGFEDIQHQTIDLSRNIGDDNLLLKEELHIPNLLISEDSLYVEIESFLKKELNFDVIGPIEYLEREFQLVLSFHSQKDENYDKYLLILDDHANVIKNWSLNKDLQKLRTESFFVFGMYLIFVVSDQRIEIKFLN